MTKARDLSKLLSTANGKIAGSNLDVSFENISDTGTEGTKVASGTTAQRGSTAGQLRFNSETGVAEYYNGSTFEILAIAPDITSISPTTLGESVLNLNQTITITGSNFDASPSVKIIGDDSTEYTPATTTRNSDTQITITTPTNLTASNEPYDIKVINGSLLNKTLINVLSINDTPVFTLASGSLGTLQNADRAGSNLTAITFTDEESTPTCSVTSGTFPTGLTLNSNGTISGTADAVTSDTTFNFTVTATDGSESATRDYSITVIAPISVEYLVIAGGGGGGSDGASTGRYGGAGGGAGGYRSSISGENSGGGASAESSIAVLPSTTYTVTVGGGGSGGNYGGNTGGGTGTNSSISGSGISTITSNGGGGGAGSFNGGGSGGSGGGGSQGGGGYGGTSGQGFSGGDRAGNDANGGGGGAGGSGSTYQGGVGVQSSVTGSSTYRAGGGGGASGGSGGQGGGANANGNSGTTNTGGGGAGRENNGGDGGAGGSGIVFLKIKTSQYTGTTTGSPTVSTVGDYKILQFTGSGTYTA